MGKSPTMLGFNTIIRTRNTLSPYPYSRGRKRRKFARGALSELTGADYAAEIAACDKKRSSVDMATNLEPYVVKAVKAVPLSQILSAKSQIIREGKLPSHVDGRILASIKKSLGRTRLEESKRRLIRSLAIEVIKKSIF